MVKMLLDKAGIGYRFVDAEEDVEATKSFNIRKAPTLVVPNGDSYETYENASNIKAFIEAQA